MWIKLIITVISFLLLFEESFKVLEKFKKGYKRIVLVISLGILFILSVIDIVNEVNEGNDLIKKANTIITQSDTLIGNTNFIITDLKKNIKSLEETSKSIVKIDSVIKGVRDTLTNQVVILKSAVDKSKELVKLEGLKFQQDEAIILSYSKDIVLTKNVKDSTTSNFKYRIVNKGKRTAKIIKLNIKLYYYSIATRELFNIELTHKKRLPTINNEIPYNSSMSGEFGLSWRKTSNKFDALLFIINCNYKDITSNKNLIKNDYYLARDLKSDTIKFTILNDYELAMKLNDKLNQDNLKDYLIDLDELLDN